MPLQKFRQARIRYGPVAPLASFPGTQPLLGRSVFEDCFRREPGAEQIDNQFRVPLAVHAPFEVFYRYASRFR